ncbi:MAG: hypothetical protein Q8K60_00435 [Parachlamydiaceae bacterium]|nr:hypothetical protein [Parachlamydiaceae bacterium]
MKPNDQTLSNHINKRSLMILKVLMNRFHPAEKQHLIDLMPAEEQKAMSSNLISSADIAPIYHFQSQLDHVHYSWIEEALKTASPFWKSIAIASLSHEQKEALRDSTVFPLSGPMKSLIQNRLCQNLKITEHYPKEYLPKNEFSTLLDWNKEDLLHLIDFLGLFDLATEVRHIVNTQDLKSIYSCLNAKQFHFLKLCLNKKDKITSPKLGLKPSQLDRKKLKQILHLRGLSRFGRALCGLPYDFVWTLSHSLDIGRGRALLKDYQLEKHVKITPLLQQQVMKVMDFLKREVIRE